jgi:hypothetical protein
MAENEDCCSSLRKALVTRVVLHPEISKEFTRVIKTKTKLTKETIDFKTASLINGASRRVSDERSGAIQQKAARSNPLRTIGHTALSLAVPGDSDPFRSPVRSAIYRTLTPGFGGGGLGGRRRSKPYRCPEGYQYGGRFTDSRLSTCGVKLFDIPSPLGMALSAIARQFRPRKAQTVTGNPLVGGEYPEALIQARKPQIPKVSASNGRLADIRVKELTPAISQTPQKVTRMIRRDGFVLEPVVTSKVLREIPDNRDMEGAIYMMSAFGSADIGGDELGMLSNSGIKKVIYVTPNGSTLNIEKTRQLTVGERRKLGKTVTQAISQNNSKDPAAKLKYLSEQMGDGIGYSEDFLNIKNPNEMQDGKPRWAIEIFKRKNQKRVAGISGSESRETVSSAAAKKKIKSINEAMEFLASGGSLSEIHPSILPRVLSQSSAVSRTKVSSNQNLITVGTNKYFEYVNPKTFQHIGERFASDLQEHLGLPSPDILLAGKAGDKRRYLRQDVETALNGSVFNPNATLNDLKPEDVAKLMVSDYLTDQRERDLSSVYGMQTVDGITPMVADNTTSGLTDLSKIQITKRTKMSIAEFYGEPGKINYSEYYQQLKVEQQLAYRRSVESLLKRARAFKLRDLRSRLDIDGLTPGEINHLKIVDKLFTTRVELLTNQKNQLIKFLKG